MLILNRFMMKVAILFSLISASLLSSMAFADGEVRLLSVFSSIGSHYANRWQNSKVKIAVKNLGVEKKVFLHMNDGSGEWRDIPVKFEENINGGWDLFTSSGFTGDEIYDLTFAVKYEVNGKTYWDNNNGKNYEIEANSGHFIRPEVMVESIYASPKLHMNNQEVWGTVVVKNLAPKKEVKFIYTTDNWNTIKSIPLEFSTSFIYGYSHIDSPTLNGTEYWTLNFKVEEDVKTIEYAISYEVKGKIYWDNNFGRNYILEVVDSE